jgi:hypothetical protein
MYTAYDYIIFQWWQSGVWWYTHGRTCVITDDYRSPYRA